MAKTSDIKKAVSSSPPKDYGSCIRCGEALKSWIYPRKHCAACLHKIYGKPPTKKQVFARKRNWNKARLKGFIETFKALSCGDYTIHVDESITFRTIQQALEVMFKEWERRTESLKCTTLRWEDQNEKRKY